MLILISLHSFSSGGRQGSGNPGVMGAGSIREEGDGIPKGAGVGRNRK